MAIPQNNQFAGPGGTGNLPASDASKQYLKLLVHTGATKYREPYLDFIEMKRWKKTVSGDSWSHFFLPKPETQGVVGTITVASTGPGTDVTFQIPTGQGLYNSAGTRSLFAENEIVEFKGANNHGKQAQIMAVDTTTDNAHTIRVRPLDAAVDLVTAVTNTTFFRVGYAAPYGSSAPEGRIRTVLERTYTLQMLWEAISDDGSNLANETWYESGHSVFGTEQSQYSLQHLLMIMDFRRSKGRTLMVQEKSNQNTLTANTPYTEGLIPQIVNGGGTINGIDPATMTLTQFDTKAKRAKANDGPMRYAGWVGQNYAIGIENMMASNVNLTIDFGSKITRPTPFQNPMMKSLSDANSWALIYGWAGLKKGGCEWYWTTYDAFDNVDGMGGAGSRYRDMAVWVPDHTTPIRANGRSYEIPPVCIAHKGLGTINREYIIKTEAGIVHPDVGQFTNELIDRTKTGVFTHMGLEVFAPYQFQIDGKNGTI